MLDDGVYDFSVSVHEEPASWHIRKPLFDQASMCIYDPEQLKVKGPLSLEDFSAAAHVSGVFRGSSTANIDVALAKRGTRRRVVAQVPRFACLADGVAGNAGGRDHSEIHSPLHGGAPRARRFETTHRHSDRAGHDAISARGPTDGTARFGSGGFLSKWSRWRWPFRDAPRASSSRLRRPEHRGCNRAREAVEIARKSGDP